MTGAAGFGGATTGLCGFGADATTGFGTFAMCGFGGAAAGLADAGTCIAAP